MVPPLFRPLAAALAWSYPTALLARSCLPAAALVVAVGFLVAVHTAGRCSLAGRSRLAGRCRLAGLCALPVLLAALAPQPVAPRVPSAGPAWVTGTVRSVVRAPITGHTCVDLDGDVRLGFPGEVELLAGDRLRVLARCRQPSVPGVAAALQAIPATLSIERSTWSFRTGCSGLRRAMERQLLRIVPGEHGAMLATLVLGRATRPSADVAAAHRATGLSHLLAVSGAHAAMLAFLLGMSSRGRHLGAGRTRSLVVLLVLLVYGCIAGAEPPVLRAVVAYALAALAARSGRPFPIATGLLVPACITCLVEPDALTSPSFLLSYAAVIGLAMALRRRRPETPGEWLADGLRASFWATLLTAPFTLAFFGQLAPWTIVLTPLCAPLVAAMLLTGLVAASGGLLAAGFADVLAWPLQTMAGTYAWIVQFADHFPGTPIPAWFRPPPWAMAVGAATAGACLWRWPGRRTLILCVSAFGGLWFVPLQDTPDARFSLFAVGHGQAALIRTARGEQIVVDCGSMQGGARAARCVTDALQRYRLDLLVITHGDADHHNGVPHLLERVTVHRALMPRALAASELHQHLERHGCEIVLLEPGDRTVAADGFEVAAPDLPAHASDNDRSLWARLRLGTHELLLTGDAQEAGTAAMLASGFAQPCEVLVLPHHGRANRNAPHLLRRTKPAVCLASAATGDGRTRLGELVRTFGAELCATGLLGTVTIRGSPMRIESDPELRRGGSGP